MWNVTGLDTYMQYYAELFVFVLCVCGDRSIDVHVLAHVCVCLCCVGVVSFSTYVCMCGRIDNDNHRECDIVWIPIWDWDISRAGCFYFVRQ